METVEKDSFVLIAVDTNNSNLKSFFVLKDKLFFLSPWLILRQGTTISGRKNFQKRNMKSSMIWVSGRSLSEKKDFGKQK